MKRLDGNNNSFNNIRIEKDLEALDFDINMKIDSTLNLLQIKINKLK